MASSLTGTQFASITSSSYSSLSWIGSYTLQSQDPITNKSVLRLYGSLRNTNEYGYSYGSDYSTLKVNNVTVYDDSYRAYAGYEVMGYTDLTVTHNADGTFPSQSISISAYSYHFSNQSATGTISGIPSLDRVAPTVTVSLASRTSNSLTINATASATCDYWEFSRDDGSTFPYTSSTEGTAVSYTFTGLSPNTTYNIKVRARKKVNQIKGTSARGAYTTIGNALLNSVAEVYADASTVIIKPNMTVYGASFTYSLEIKRGNTSILTLSIPAQSTGTKDVSVTLTSAQRTTLLNGMSNVASFSATYILTTLNNGTQVGSTSSATAMIRTSSSTSAPGQASFSYADTNAKTVAVTGDSTKLVQGQSTLRLTNLTATAKNGASVASYNITIGGVTKSVTSGGTVEMGVISQSGTLSLSVVVTDTRGYTSTKTVSVTSYAYAPPTISAYSVKRNASTSTQIDMSFSGVFSNIGSNTVTATYKYKQSTAGSYSAETSVTPTTSGGTFSYSGTNVATFDDEYVYDFVITLSDGILTESYYMRVPSYEPLIGFRPNSVGFGTVPQQQFNLETSDRWGTHFRGQYNRSEYGSYSFSTPGVDGTAGWIRIATITFKPTVGTFASEPIRFEVARRYDSKTVNLYIRFTHVNNTDPDVDYFYYECSNAGLYYDQPFGAYAVKTSSGIFDVYVKKDTQWGWVDVNSFVPAFMGYRCTISYVDNLTTSVPANAVMATQLPMNNTVKHNISNYLPYSWYATGGSTAGWSRIATITIIDTQADAPIEFLVQRRHDGVSVKLSVMFAGGNTTDPTLESFYFDDLSGTRSTRLFQAFIYKTGTSTWDVYVYDSTSYCSIGVYALLSRYAQLEANITYANASLSSVPSDAVMATQKRILNYAIQNAIRYLPYSNESGSDSDGTAGYARIATITFTSARWRNVPIEFEVMQRYQTKSARLFIKFAASSIDPALGTFYTDSNEITAFAYKRTTSTWDIYVLKGASTDRITVFTSVSRYVQTGLEIAYDEGVLSAVPSGATMATIVPCTTPTVTITKTSGNSTASAVALERSGNVCHLSFNITTTASISVGGNAFVGTTTAPKPIKAQTNASYYGSSVIVTDFGASGTITVRINGASLASGAVAYCNVIYLTNE